MFSKGLSEGTRKRVELAVAVAQERLLSAHVDHALDLIALVDDQVSFTDALDIYARILRLDEDHAQNISTRALAILGEKAGDTGSWPEPAEPLPEAEEEEGSGRSIFGNLRQRLRGRVNEDLRRKIEFIAARTEVALIRTHVDNAMQFVEILDEHMEEKEAVELYLDALDVRESIAEVTYYLALARVADAVLPEHGQAVRAADGKPVARPREDAADRLHAVE